MIVLVANLRIQTEKRAEFLALTPDLISGTREEAGCISYRLYEETDQPNQFVFVEEWENQEALDSHGKQPHYLAFSGVIGNLLDGTPDIKIHEVAATKLG